MVAICLLRWFGVHAMYLEIDGKPSRYENADSKAHLLGLGIPFL